MFFFLFHPLCFACNGSVRGCEQRGGTERPAGGVGALVRRLMRVQRPAATEPDGYAAEAQECTQNAAHTKSDRRLRVNNLHKIQKRREVSWPDRRTDGRTRVRWSASTSELRSASAVHESSARLAAPESNRAVLTSVRAVSKSTFFCVNHLALPSGWR